MSRSSLRVMLVTGSLAHGGAERQSITLMNRLAERRHECHLVHVKRAGTEQLDRVRPGAGGSIRCLNAERYLDRGAVAGFATHMARTGPDVVIAANAYALMYASLALRLSGRRIPLIATFHSMRLLATRERLQMLGYRPFFWFAACTVFVCESQRRYWSRRGLLSRRNVVIYNGVDTEEYCDRADAAARRESRAALGFDEADYVIGISARLSPEKNPLQLVEAIARLRGRGIAARLLMIGDGILRGAIEARARELKVEGALVMAGFQRDVRPCVAACDAMVLCSHTEAFSLAAIEAMAMGKPVVHSLVGGAAEMIQPGDNGYLFPAGDTGALVDRLARLADAETRDRMGRRARSTAEARFSEAAMVDRYEELMIDLVRRGPAARLSPPMPWTSIRTTPRVQRRHAGGRDCAEEGNDGP